MCYDFTQRAGEKVEGFRPMSDIIESVFEGISLATVWDVDWRRTENGQRRHLEAP